MNEESEVLVVIICFKDVAGKCQLFENIKISRSETFQELVVNQMGVRFDAIEKEHEMQEHQRFCLSKKFLKLF